MNTRGKIWLTITVISLAVIGFMAKLPSSFRTIDKELHASFYFLAAAFFNMLYTNKIFVVHILIFILLLGMSAGIEYAQEASNAIVGRRIHGRFDKEDIQWNCYGLVAFSFVWLGHIILSYTETLLFIRKTNTD